MTPATMKSRVKRFRIQVARSEYMRGCIIYLNPFNVHCIVFACLIQLYLAVFGTVSYSHTWPVRSGFDEIKTWYLRWLPDWQTPP